MEIFVLSLILLASTPGDQDMVLPLVGYETREACEQKLKVLDEGIKFKNPVISIDCYPLSKFKEKEEKKEGQDL